MAKKRWEDGEYTRKLQFHTAVLLAMDKNKQNTQTKDTKAFRISHCELHLIWKVLLANARSSHTRSQTAWWQNEAEHNQVFGD